MQPCWARAFETQSQLAARRGAAPAKEQRLLGLEVDQATPEASRGLPYL